ncbi:hypothetical protein ABES80_15480 [Bacillus gobiensis]|uniref:hypothetical protein n=1 Tax=Bacillus gobiensis TaxID=1441095 RepID=UPI003D21E8DA
MSRALVGTRLKGSLQNTRTRVEIERYTLYKALGAFIKADGKAECVRTRTIHDYRKHVLKKFLKE